MDKSVKLYIFFCSLFCTVVITGNLIFQKFVTVNMGFKAQIPADKPQYSTNLLQ
jgi:hypothetical protein